MKTVVPALALLGLIAMPLRGQADETHLPTGYVGIRLKADDGSAPVVLYVIPKSSADAAGIQADDRITAVNGVATQGMPAKKVLLALDGDAGTTVQLTIQHAGSADRDVSLVRRSFLEIYLPAANAGDPEAQTALARARQYGAISGVSRDLAEAAAWYRKAAGQGYAPAEASLGYLYAHGLGVPKDAESAAAWSLKAAKQGYAAAETNLAIGYLNGTGVAQSDRDAFNWFYSAARQDNSTAEEYLGFLYRQGRGVTRDNRAAFAWYYRSAQLGNSSGDWGLAYMYEFGRGVPENDAKALKWYLQAEKGFPENLNLKKQIAVLSLKTFLETRHSSPLDLSLFMSAFRRELLILSSILLVGYVVGGATLLYFSFKTPPHLPGFLFALGWLGFYIESQAAAFPALYLFGKSVTAGTFLGVTALFCAVPVIISSCGTARTRLWQAPSVSWKRGVLYVAASFLTVLAISFVYEKAYTAIVHSPFPSQPTIALLGNAKDTSTWEVFWTAVLLMPVAEEILFRGYLFDALRRRCPGWATIVITAVVFSLVHFQGYYFVLLLSDGLILGWIKLRTDSLRLPVLLHVANNALLLCLLA